MRFLRDSVFLMNASEEEIPWAIGVVVIPRNCQSPPAMTVGIFTSSPKRGGFRWGWPDGVKIEKETSPPPLARLAFSGSPSPLRRGEELTQPGAELGPQVLNSQGGC